MILQNKVFHLKTTTTKPTTDSILLLCYIEYTATHSRSPCVRPAFNQQYLSPDFWGDRSRINEIEDASYTVLKYKIILGERKRVLSLLQKMSMLPDEAQKSCSNMPLLLRQIQVFFKENKGNSSLYQSNSYHWKFTWAFSTR